MSNYNFISDISNQLITYYKEDNVPLLIEELNNEIDKKINDEKSSDPMTMDLSLNEDINTIKIYLRKKISNNINNKNVDKTDKAQNNQNMNQYLYIYFH